MAAKKKPRRSHPRTKKVFIDRLSQLLNERGWDTFALSRAAIVRQQTINGWLTRCYPGPEHLAAVAAALDVSMDYLWGRTNHRTTAPDPKQGLSEKSVQSMDAPQ